MQLTEADPTSASATGGPAGFRIDSRPNPFTVSTTIRWELPHATSVTLRIFDVQGKLVRVLRDGPTESGPGGATWDGRDRAGRRAPAGVYFYRVSAGDVMRTGRLVLLR